MNKQTLEINIDEMENEEKKMKKWKKDFSKIKSPKSFIKKIHSSSSLQSIPLVKTLSNISSHEVGQPRELTSVNSASIASNSSLRKMKKEEEMDYQFEYCQLEEEDDLFAEIEKISNHSLENKKKVKMKKKELEKEKKENENESESEKKKNQLFQQEPPEELIVEIMHIFLGENITNPFYQFSRKMLEDKKVIEQLGKWIPELKKYYLKCKHQKYLENLDSKKVITLFRQLIRLKGYSIEAHEKYQNGNKFLLYHIERKEKGRSIKSPKKTNFTLDFN
jgi:hypothetical protein